MGDSLLIDHIDLKWSQWDLEPLEKAFSQPGSRAKLSLSNGPEYHVNKEIKAF